MIDKTSPLGATRCFSQILARCLEQQTRQGKCDLRDACSLRRQRRLHTSAKERSKFMHALSRTENQGEHVLPADGPQIFTTPSWDYSTTVRKAYHAEYPVHTKRGQITIIERQLLTFSISWRHWRRPPSGGRSCRIVASPRRLLLCSAFKRVYKNPDGPGLFSDWSCPFKLDSPVSLWFWKRNYLPSGTICPPRL